MKPAAGKVTSVSGIVGYLLDHQLNDSFVAVNRLLASNEEVYWVKNSFTANGKTWPAGTELIPAKSTTLPKLQKLASDADNLVLRIFSFSFHRGLPKDESGNGGGFVFDGRSLPNPGREERFKSLTGKDAAVVDYLNQQESVHQFLASVLSLVDASVSNYQQRGFKSLMVSFGCTGGQHRSVYLAEQVAKRLRGRNGLEVVVTHRELERMAAENARAEKAAT